MSLFKLMIVAKDTEYNIHSVGVCITSQVVDFEDRQLADRMFEQLSQIKYLKVIKLYPV